MGVALWIRERTKRGHEMAHIQCNANCDESHCTKKRAIGEFSRNASRVNGSVDTGNHSMNKSRETKADYDKLVAAYAYAISDSPSLHERNDPRWADDIPESHRNLAAEKNAEQ